MTIEGRLFANLADLVPTSDGRTTLDMPDGSTVGDVAQAIGIPPAMARIVLVNGHDADERDRLTSGDVVTFVPPLAGGR